jgi:hypothetical protein
MTSTKKPAPAPIVWHSRDTPHNWGRSDDSEAKVGAHTLRVAQWSGDTFQGFITCTAYEVTLHGPNGRGFKSDAAAREAVVEMLRRLM